MIAEKTFRPIAHSHDSANRFQRLRASVNNVTDKNQTTLRRDLFKEFLQSIKTTVNVSDGKGFQSLLRLAKAFSSDAVRSKFFDPLQYKVKSPKVSETLGCYPGGNHSIQIGL